MKKNKLLIFLLIAVVGIAWTSKKRKAGELILSLDEGEFLKDYPPAKPDEITKKMFDI